MMRKLLQGSLLLVGALLLAACGTVATPEWAADAQSTRAALAVTSEYETSIAPTATPIPPTATPTLTVTPLPTATSVPPTATPEPPTATTAPATEEATAAAEAAAASAEGELSEADVEAVAAALEAGDPTNGQAVFARQIAMPDGAQWACSTCHSVTPDELRLIGPGQWNLVYRAGTRIEGQNAVEYIRNSILHPNDYIAPAREGEPGYPPGLMPGAYEQVLTEQELNDVVAYLLTLRE